MFLCYLDTKRGLNCVQGFPVQAVVGAAFVAVGPSFEKLES